MADSSDDSDASKGAAATADDPIADLFKEDPSLPAGVADERPSRAELKRWLVSANRALFDGEGPEPSPPGADAAGGGEPASVESPHSAAIGKAPTLLAVPSPAGSAARMATLPGLSRGLAPPPPAGSPPGRSPLRAGGLEPPAPGWSPPPADALESDDAETPPHDEASAGASASDPEWHPVSESMEPTLLSDSTGGAEGQAPPWPPVGTGGDAAPVLDEAAGGLAPRWRPAEPANPAPPAVPPADTVAAAADAPKRTALGAALAGARARGARAVVRSLRPPPLPTSHDDGVPRRRVPVVGIVVVLLFASAAGILVFSGVLPGFMARPGPSAAPAEPAPAAKPPSPPPPPPAPEPVAEAPPPPAPEPAAPAAEPTDLADDGTPGELLRRARKLIGRGDPVRAAALMRRVLARDPRDHHAMVMLARALLAQNQGAEAAEWVARAIQKRPRRARYRVLHGDALQQAGDQAGARAAWQKALELEPDDRSVKRRLGM